MGHGTTTDCLGEGSEWTEEWVWDDAGRPVANRVDGVARWEWQWDGDDLAVSRYRGEVWAEYEWDDAGRMVAAHDDRKSRFWRWDADGVLRRHDGVVDDGTWTTTWDGRCPPGTWREWAPEDPAPSPGPAPVVIRPYGT